MKYEVHHDSSVPLYKQVVQFLSDTISSSKWKPGDRIPSEADLMEIFGVSRITIRSAISELVEEGILTRAQGKGTFVATPKSTYDANDAIGFTRSCMLAGKTASTRVISTEMVFPTQHQLGFFNISSSDMILCSKRLRYVDGEPTQIEINHYHPRFSFLINENLEGSLFELFKNKLNIEIINAQRTLETCFPTKEEMALLNLKKTTPLLLFRDVQIDKDKQPLYLSKQLYNTENLKFYF